MAESAARVVSLREVVVVWAGLGALAMSIFVTYTHVPLSSLYHVSHTGISGGVSRTLVALNYPGAFIAIALLGFSTARLFDVSGPLSHRERIVAGGAAAVALMLCLVAGLPGVVSQGDLDAKPINVLPALGVALSLAMTIFAIRRTGSGTSSGWSQVDLTRTALAAAIVVLALPWVLADLGVYIGDVPGIGGWFMSKEQVTSSGLPAVHLGHHHGVDGVAFALSALLLSRELGSLRTSRLRYPLTGYVALMFVYGLANAAQDFWGEQLVKRGTTGWEFPSVLQPAATPAWELMLIAVGVLTFVLLRVERSGWLTPSD